MPPVSQDQVSTHARRLLSARKVADRYSVHIRTLARWTAKKVIPPPDECIAGRRYWYEHNLEAADRARTIAAGAGTESHPNENCSFPR
jgi:hypothetical protein